MLQHFRLKYGEQVVKIKQFQANVVPFCTKNVLHRVFTKALNGKVQFVHKWSRGFV